MNSGYPDTHTDAGPSSMLEVYMYAIDSPVGDDFLDQSSLGLGNYNYREYWQQIHGFKQGLYADTAMSRRLLRRAVEEAKRSFARDVFNGQSNFAGPPTDEYDHQSYVDEYKEQLWEELGETREQKIEKQIELLEKYTGINRKWVPPHWRMLKMKHEASRSKGARLIDNLFERVQEVKQHDEEFDI